SRAKGVAADSGNLRLGFTVNPRKNLYLTDFLNRTFAGENAKNRDSCDRNTINSPRIYYPGINHDAALLRCAWPSSRKPLAAIRDLAAFKAPVKSPDNARGAFPG